ncbi:hypothetical protein KIN20_015274 [Parelaphostrongylus tenuis]|uniref:tRNA (uracil-O(2)-)-methyltransferase n=1 Tax=Parelaphostrongylus tenuis TaxID=148309 RepID=A0AAD5QM48_PARTN|nr:hypothetical protein KIN20_015274 [Parelaphostrongylus tenuis]
MLWRILCEDTATYGFPVCGLDYFDKLLLIWKSQCQSVNRRLFGTVKVDIHTEEYREVVHRAMKLADCSDAVERFDVRKLVPKDITFSQSSYEVSFPEDDSSVVFVPVQLGCESKKFPHIPFSYKLSFVQLSDCSVRLSVSVPTSVHESDCKWTLSTMFPAVVKWLRFIDPQKEMRSSNRLLDIEKYIVRYATMKEKYARQLVQNWTEKTDPKKFVYEDCGIASYLLELWRIRGRTPEKFVDVGCGNGLLVHLLNKEGVGGIGIDIRSRRIWADQLNDTTLIEAVVDPSQGENPMFDGVDYIIGNHTDELTPWIPIMAARKNCGFFVLPCCPFNFHGKYIPRPGDTGSQYQSFLKFLREVFTRLGFIVEEDRLSIPSTKRLCFVCSIPPNGLVPNIEEVIDELTHSATNVFQPRVGKEQVRNCLNIPKDLRTTLIHRFFNTLLERSNDVKDGWRCGGVVELSELAALLSDEERQLMKQQCGGLQTFLRNQHQIFKVIGGKALIRDWREEGASMKKSRVNSSHNKIAICWMAGNHPDGCPMGDRCGFKHPQKA